MIAIVDMGSQYTHLIKRNMRDLGKEATVINNKSGGMGDAEGAEAVILSGGPSSVTEGNLGLGEAIVKKVGGGWDMPLLGICFGHQLIAHVLGGRVEKGASAEYGLGTITVDEEDLLFRDLPGEFKAWVSHFDEMKELPEGFAALAHSGTCMVEAMRHRERKIFGTQFHPEVWHTENGEKILENFLSAV